MIKFFLVFTLLGIFSSGCSSISTLQDARTTNKGEFDHNVALGLINIEVGEETSSDGAGVEIEAGDDLDGFSLPTFDYMFRYGLAEGVDFGVRTNIVAHGVDVKFRLVNTGAFHFALGVGISQLDYTLKTETTTSDVKATDIIPAAFMTYMTSDNFGLYLVAKSHEREVKTVTVDSADSSNDGTTKNNYSLVGGSFGVKWGQVAGLILEQTILSDKDLDLSQTSIGIFVH